MKIFFEWLSLIFSSLGVLYSLYLLYDEIACGLMIKKIQKEDEELLTSLELFYKVFFLGEEVE